MAQNIHSLIAGRTRATPDAIAIAAPQRPPLSYSRLLAQIEYTVCQLNAIGIGRGDRVAIVLPNGPEMAVAFLAVAAGATSAPLNPAYRESEFDFYLSDLEAKALMLPADSELDTTAARTAAQDRGMAVIEFRVAPDDPAGVFTFGDTPVSSGTAPVLADADDDALVLHTSGTTSRPKIVPLAHRNVCASAGNIGHTLALSTADCCLNIMPLFHIHGLIGATLSSLAAGASLVATPGFVATRFFDWMDEFRPTWYTAVPTMHQAILTRATAQRDVIERNPLRLIRSSSSSLPPTVMAELEDVFGAPVIESYGMTEASHQMASNLLPPGDRKAGSVGVAAGPDVAVMDEGGRLLANGETGEVVIRGDNVFTGYQNNPEANRDAFTDGWFRTGDQGYMDEQNYLFLTGRLKELINRGGEKISPREIDEVLMDHPAIGQAVAFAMPDPKLGEEVAAAVVLRDRVTATEREILQFAAERLADFKLPRKLLIVDEIPKGPTGKLQRIGLAEKLGVSGDSDDATDEPAPHVEPRNETEKILTDICVALLEVDRPGVHDNFFAHGGDSLMATHLILRVREALHVDLPIYVLFESPTIAGMAEYIEALAQAEPSIRAEPVERLPRGPDAPPLSASQRALWVHSKLTTGLPDENRPGAVRLSGPLDVQALRSSLTEIWRRHETLRTSFPVQEQRPVVAVAPPQPIELPVEDLSSLTDQERYDRLQRAVITQAQQTFDLETGPLYRTLLIKLDEQEHVMLLTFHHIIFDGWSMGVLLGELGVLYEAIAAGQAAPLSDLPVQYADYAAWQARWLASDELDDQISYWKQQLGGDLPSLALPTDRPHPDHATWHGDSESMTLPAATYARLQELSHEASATPFMTLLAVVSVLLHRLSGQEQIVVGTFISNRNRVELESLIGMFVNNLVLRTDLVGDPTFRELLSRTRQVALDAYANHDVPFEALVKTLKPKLTLGQNPLFNVAFQLRNLPAGPSEAGAIQMKELHLETGIARFDLFIEAFEQDDALVTRFEYNTDLFDHATIARWMEDWQMLLNAAVGNADRPISTLLT